VSLNCAAIPEALLESELFGHARGAFTGAFRDQPGLFEAARGGTLLLDEVGDMPAAMQAKLLRVLQEGRFRRVGEQQERASDARIISASLHDLGALVAAGRFREDLFYRLNVVAIAVPPLRERPEDIPLLVDLFLDEIAPRPAIDRAALALLLSYRWPGNARELRNELHRAAALSDGRIAPGDLSPQLASGEGPPAEARGSLAAVREAAERHAIRRALERAGGSVTVAARLLGISRVVLHRKLRRHAIGRGDAALPGADQRNAKAK
jgi:transcriptional regulator with PAS, ATPase and Fis domain